LRLALAGADKYEAIIVRCARDIAPTEQGKKWLKAFNDLMDKEGLENTLRIALADPADIHPVHPMWRHTKCLLPDGSIVTGQQILVTFADAYRMFQKVKKLDKRTPYVLEAEHNQALNELCDFRTWRQAPQTAVFIEAVANRRHIEGELGGWVPSPAKRNSDLLVQATKQAPLALPAPTPPKPTNT
jgi:hypothetical protein